MTHKCTLILGLAALLSAGLLAQAGGLKGTLSVKGSDTMLPLASAWAEAFMKANPGVNISITGGGSGTGIAALINGTTDICASSREIQAGEVKAAKDKGITPKATIVARDGIAIVVNPKNPIKDITLAQLEKIYTGAWANWKELGVADQKIVALSRESSSGTYVFFQEHVLAKKDYAASVRLMPATSAIIQSVSSDKWSIGYVGLGYAIEAGKKVKMLPVKAKDDAPAVKPSEKTVKSGQYSIARPLYYYTNTTLSPLAKAFIDFCNSKAGQQIVRENGYVTVK